MLSLQTCSRTATDPAASLMIAATALYIVSVGPLGLSRGSGCVRPAAAVGGPRPWCHEKGGSIPDPAALRGFEANAPARSEPARECWLLECLARRARGGAANVVARADAGRRAAVDQIDPIRAPKELVA